MVLTSQFLNNQQSSDPAKVGGLLLASLDHAVGMPGARERLINAYADNNRSMDSLSAFFVQRGEEPIAQVAVGKSVTGPRPGGR